MLRNNLFILLLIAFVLPVNSQEESKKMTIMGIGDSITEGSKDFTCYIYPLWKMLSSSGVNFEFIGPRNSPTEIGNIRCCGFGGKTVEYIEERIDSIYRIYKADIVLLHAGHNHFVEEKPVEGIMESYKSLIEKIRSINPDVYILVAKIINSGKLPKYSYIPILNKKIEKLIYKINSDHIILVDQEANFDWRKHTIHDKVHPNKEGGEIMASVWYESIMRIMK